MHHFVQIGGAWFALRMQAVVALNIGGLAREQGEGGSTPYIGTDAPFIRQQFGAFQHFYQDGTGTHQLYMSLAAFVGGDGM